MEKPYHIEKTTLPNGTEVATVVYDIPKTEPNEEDIMVQPMEKKTKKSK